MEQTGPTEAAVNPSHAAIPFPQPGPLLVVISGPSGAGKDCILDQLRARGVNGQYVVTMTTRAPRSYERDGVDYQFIPEVARFEELIAAGELLEWAEVYQGRFYGTPKQPVVAGLAQGRDVFVRVDVRGAASIRKIVPDAVLVFVAPPSLAALEQRLRKRNTEPEDRIAERMATARREVTHIPWFDYVIINRDGALEEAVDQLAAILQAERLRTHPRQVRLP